MLPHLFQKAKDVFFVLVVSSTASCGAAVITAGAIDLVRALEKICDGLIHLTRVRDWPHVASAVDLHHICIFQRRCDQFYENPGGVR